MAVLKNFETLLTGFPGILSASSFGQLEKWANKTPHTVDGVADYIAKTFPGL
jgi:hypothetical protein